MAIHRKLALLAALALTLGSATLAQARPDTTRMSCGAVQNLVERAGAIVLSTGGHTYDRIVTHRGFCTPHEQTKVLYVPSLDGACEAGYTCEQIYGKGRGRH